MKRKLPPPEESESSESDMESQDSDEELVEAFERGDLKPGLNIRVPAPRQFANNTAGLKSKLEETTLKLDWVERLDLTTDLTLIADTIVKEKGADKPQYKVETPGDQIIDDLQRETLFYRQAQSAIIEGLARLKALGIPTKRPDDYFAQMAKSDEHMLKVKRRVLSMQVSQEKANKVKKLRELKKYGKKVQVEVGLQRAKEKREMLAKVKEFREGKLASLDFLEENEGKRKKNSILESTKQKTKEHNEMKRMNSKKGGKGKLKRQEKDKKFGFGGKKSGAKKNNMKFDDGPSSGKRGGNKGKPVRPGNRNKKQGGNKPKGGGRNKR